MLQLMQWLASLLLSAPGVLAPTNVFDPNGDGVAEAVFLPGHGCIINIEGLPAEGVVDAALAWCDGKY